jgi:hypothetical protein
MKLYTHLSIAFFLSIISTLFTAHATPPQNTENTIFSILSYVKLGTNTPLICTVNKPSLHNQLLKSKHSQHKYKLKNISISDIKNNNCNVIIFSTLSAKEEKSILNSDVNFPALSISTNNINCEEGSAICLYNKGNQTAFKINLESVNQSKVSIDPRILLLAKESE